MILYLDTSALVKLYAAEPGRMQTCRAVNRADLVATSLLANVETRAAFARKNRMRQLSDAELERSRHAFEIVQDDGKPLSMQYLNDIENGRCGAPPDYVLKQLANVLRVERDLLYFRAGRIPPDLQKRLVSDARAVATFAAFRDALRPRQNKS